MMPACTTKVLAPTMGKPAHTLSIAPMLDITDRHARYLFRLISQHTLLYTEMITTGALLHGNPDRWLGHHPAEHPLALQLGGSDPEALARCCELAATYGYDEINLNAGCPSDRVSAGRFGACLMAEPALVAQCLRSMQSATTIPVTIKTRLGIDEHDDDAFLYRFLDAVAAAGCQTIILHARKAWLKGLSPKENREIPPLEYQRVYAAKERYPECTIILNGGVRTLEEAQQHLHQVDGVMIGRAAYDDPFMLAKADTMIFGDSTPPLQPKHVICRYREYIVQELDKGTALHHMSRHLLGLFHGKPGAKRFRRHISENAHRPHAGIEVIDEALEQLGSLPD